MKVPTPGQKRGVIVGAPGMVDGCALRYLFDYQESITRLLA
jgi:hypothetical protein